MSLFKTAQISSCQRKFLLQSLKLSGGNFVSKRWLSFSNPSINLNELEKFRKTSPKWWKDEFLSLRNMNQLRVPFIVDAFHSKLWDGKQNLASSYPLDDIKLLDIGCGGGILSESLARLGAQMTGIDPVKESIQEAKNHARISFQHVDREPSLDYQCTSIEEFCENNQNQFDGVIASEVLEHVDNIQIFLQCSIKCIRPGGFFFVTTLNQTLISYVGAIFLAENILGLLPKGTHEYSKFIPPESLKLILEEDYNCNVLKIHGMFFNPITFQWNWIQDQSISYALLAKKHP